MKYKNTKIFLAISLLYFFLPAFALAAGYDFFVDKNSAQATENGSEQYPFQTIGAALSHIQTNSLKNKEIFVKNGTYPESISVTNGADLTGESENGTILDADGFRNAMSFVSTKSDIKNFTIKNADATNVFVDKKSKVTITNCKIEKAGTIGVEVEKSSAKSKYKFTIKNSKISENVSKGFHISKRKISISDNEVFDNGEEGIDLHSGQKGTVSGNNIHGNEESGIEAVLAGVNLTLKNNEIENNRAQGISVQAYSAKKKGQVKISGNTIKGNRQYGIRYANYTRSLGSKKFKIFADKYVKLSKNTISENDDGDYVYE